MEQQLIRERYELSMARILKFQEEQTVTEPYRDFFTVMSRFIGLCGRVMEAVEEGTFGSWTGEELKELNEKLYEDIRGERYETSYGNPAWAVSRLGKELGRLLCFLYAEIRGDIAYAFEGRMLEMVIGNEALIEIFAKIDVKLVDFKIEMGRATDGTLLLADEITPDSCRLWDQKDHSGKVEHLDKDLFRRGLGSIIPAYEEIEERLAELAKSEGIEVAE